MQHLDSMYQSICPYVQNYLKDVPQNTAKEMILGFGAGFVIETVLTGSSSKGAAAGALTALATAIYGLITPLFKYLIGEQQRPLTSSESMCRTLSSIIGAGMVAQAFGNSSVLRGLFMDAIYFGLIDLAGINERRDLKSTAWIFVIPLYSSARTAL